ncbi:outer membrane beta-barrel protein [Aquimarina brevivitae]|uniref:Outer membrane protein with beta-barrel domain n=1 Tax=Aquimarina brevivitae TaxID=323412 RepID=A0A4Q7PFG0_9FLAO|nr:outer membrane beta-barrel protein [Aquimarina brevivitae]RZS99194.1 hypothetical protein EV197_0403 [Aquimarina brevivitae]
MNNNKNLDRLFQEKFRDFEVMPDESVWKRIKAHQQKKKRGFLVLPLWYKVAGVAAALAIVFTLFYTNFKEESTPSLVDTPKEEVPNDISNKNNTRITSDTKTKPEARPKTTGGTETTTSNGKTINRNDNATAQTSSLSTPDNISKNHTKSTYAANKTNENNFTESGATGTKNSLAATPAVDQQIKQDNEDATTGNTSSSLASTTPLVKKDEEAAANASTLDDKKSIFDAIKENKSKPTEKVANRDKKWNVSPILAPVYYDHEGNGSSVDSRFSDNGKAGQLNLSYGVQLAYQLSDKLSVRTGLSKVDLSYNTKDVGFSPTISGQNLKNVDYNANANAIYITDLDPSGSTSLASDINSEVVSVKQNEGLLNHRFNYLEVPLELKYALLDNKIGLNMIGGISTLFLQGNELSILSGDFVTPVGRINNLNEVSFSGNLGVGLDYKLTDSFLINVEPIFKYQFNAIDDNEGNFRPYYFGLYTGVSFKF